MREYPNDRALQKALAEGNEGDVRTILKEARASFQTGVAIVCPVYDRVHPMTAVSILAGTKILEERFGYCHYQLLCGSLLPDSRETLAEISVAARTKFTFWIDADVEIPVTAWVQLLDTALELYGDPMEDHGTELDVLKASTFWVCGLAYPARGPEAALAATWEKPPTLDHFKVPSMIDVSSVGLGAAVVPTACMALTSSPLFERRWLARRGRYLGEDVSFCQKLRDEHDAAILLDLNACGVAHYCEERRDLPWYITRYAMEEEATKRRRIRDGRGGEDSAIVQAIQEGEHVDPAEFHAEQERLRDLRGEA